MRAFLAIAFLLCVGRTHAESPSVELQLADQTKVRGEWTDDKLRFTTEAGEMILDPHKIKKLEFGGPGKDAIEVHGIENRLRGSAHLQVFAVGGKQYLRDHIRSLTHIRAGPTNVITDIIIPLVTLTAMEIVLGIDNIIFLAIVAGRLPPPSSRGRRIGLFAALGTRLLLLATLSFILGLTAPVFTLPELPLLHEQEAREVSWRDIILLVGGMFLIAKSTYEIHEKLERPEGHQSARSGGSAAFGFVLIQIAIIDIIFSLDSVVTAVGMVESLWVMIIAMVIAVGVMLVFAETISSFVARNPTLKILALAFLILIGVMLFAEGLGQHIEKGYVYFAMAFSVVVEVINIRMRKKTDPLILNRSELPAGIS